MAGRLLIADNSGEELFEIDPDGADSQGTLLRDLPSGLTSPFGMTDFDGRLLIADFSGAELFEIDPDGADSQGTLLRSLPSGLTGPYGMTDFDGRLLIADLTGAELFEIDPDGADSQGTLLRSLPSGLLTPGAMTDFDGRLLIADSSGDDLFEIDPDGADSQGTLLRSLPSGLNSPRGMTDFDGRLLIADGNTADLFEIDPDGADSQGTLLRSSPSGLLNPGAMTYFFANVSPSWTDDTGDDFTGTVGEAITPFTVPAVDAGVPDPTYAASGLPGGIAFDTTTREIDGTPTAAGTGTITITATNSAGSDTWTVGYTFLPVAVAPTVTIAAVADFDETDTATLTASVSGGIYDTLSYLWDIRFGGGSLSATTGASVTYTPADVTADTSVRVRCRVTGAGTGTNAGDGTSNTKQGIVEFDVLFVADLVAPVFADDQGDAQNWVVGIPITAIQVPAADGNPTPTYALLGTLPPGSFDFDENTRWITGTTTAVGSGSIRIRATNSQGSDTWIVFYTTVAAQAAPVFADDTGDDITGTVGTAISAVTVPSADGNPTPTYALVGSTPGVSFNITTRVLSFDEDAIEEGSGTIRVRATNSSGSDDWTVGYAFESGSMIYVGANRIRRIYVGDTEIQKAYIGSTKIFG